MGCSASAPEPAEPPPTKVPQRQPQASSAASSGTPLPIGTAPCGQPPAAPYGAPQFGAQQFVSVQVPAGAHQQNLPSSLREAAASLGFDGAAAERLQRALKGEAARPAHFGEEALLDSVASGAVAPLKGSWLVALHKKGGTLSRRQDLPPEAFWSAAELRRLVEALGDVEVKYEDGNVLVPRGSAWGLLFVALSYRWLSKDHPDPDGFHLGIVAKVAELYMKGRDDEYGLPCSPLTAVFDTKGLGAPDFALFWDFASLYQKPRETAAEQLFLPGLRASNVWYGHELTVCWMQTELPTGFSEQIAKENLTRPAGAQLAADYDESGWCFVEAAISAGLKMGTRRLDLGKRTMRVFCFAYGGPRWASHDKLEAVCAAARLPPLLPDEVRRRLEHEKKFTAKADVDVVDKLYRTFFEGATRFATALNFSGLKWGDEEIVHLAAVALPCFARLATLDLSENKIGARGAEALAKYVTGSAVVTSLDLSQNQLCGVNWRGNGTYDASGIQALASALAGNAVLKKIVLSDNEIKDEGAIAIGESLKTNKSLEVLELKSCDISPAGGKAISEALQLGIGVLTTLNLRYNGIGAEGAKALASALRVNGVLKTLILHSNHIGDEGAKAIGGALAVNRVLTSLDVSFNRLGDEGEGAIRDAVSGREGFELYM